MRIAQRLARHSVVVAATVAMTITLAAPVQASPPAQSEVPGTPVELSAPSLENRELDEAERLLAPYVTRSADGTFELDAPSKVMGTLSTGTLRTVDAGMAWVNQLVRSGDLASTPDLRATSVRTDADLPGIQSHGKTGISCNWVGRCTIYLGSAATDLLLTVWEIEGSIAVAVAAVCAAFKAISCALNAGLVAAFVFLGRTVVSNCANSHGVWVRNFPPGCGGQ